MTRNRTKGAARQARVKQKLESWLKNKYVEVEQYLRDANGKIVKDPLTGESLRLDIVVHDGKNAHSVFEVTSKTAQKDDQMKKERRIRSERGHYIRSRVTGTLIDVSNHVTRIMRRK